jgi:tRNA dimethylallyltransferase
MQKVLAIVGPTAVGKTSFGIECANTFNGEIISGDSIQIYKGLDIGSAKPSKTEQAQAKHYLLDIKEANENYSVKQFQELGRFYIDEISSRNKLPIIVGGTGLYIKALLYDYNFMEENNEDNQYEDLSNEDLYNRLKQLDPKALEKIHINNRKRLVRALNIIEKHNVTISAIKDAQNHKPIYDCLIIGLTRNRQELYELIDKRVDKMIEDGLIIEIDNLLKSGITFDNQAMQAIGYKEFKDYFNGEKSLEECINQVKINSRHFAKRQYTFFKNQLDMLWYEDKNEALDRIKQWLI